MADPASDFLKDYQTLAQQSWEAWTRQFQPPAANPFAPPQASAGNDTLERTLSGLKGYFDWMQGALAGNTASAGPDWRQQLQQMFDGAGQPFVQAFGGIDSAGAEGFMRQWQDWIQAVRNGGFGDLPGSHGPTPGFGLDREKQMQQQALAGAMLAAMQATARYQELIQRANAEGVQILQAKLAEPGRKVESLKALYDLWVDASEEAYAAIALSDEFRQVYGEMIDSQMRVRQLQQQQTEEWCRQLGMPTRSEVSSLGERLQALRREVRAGGVAGGAGQADEVQALRREVAALKRQLAASVPGPVATKPVAAKPATPRKAAAKKAAPARKAAKATKAVKTTASRPAPRKRK